MLIHPTTVNASLAVESCNTVLREEGSADVADQTADAVDGKNVEGIINAEKELKLGCVVCERRTQDSENNGCPWGNISFEKSVKVPIYRTKSLYIPEPGVMDTRPATTPEQNPTVENFFSRR